MGPVLAASRRDPPVGAAEDVRLARLAAEGDRHAKRLVANRLVHRVRRQTQLLLGSRSADADDASQQALLAVLEAIGSFRGEASLEWWAARITARAVLRHARQRRADHLRHEDVGDASAWAADQRPPPGLAPEIDRFLTRLSPVQAEALVLKHAYGFTIEEIAEELGVPVGTIKDRLVTARQRLRELIASEAPGVPERGGRG